MSRNRYSARVDSNQGEIVDALGRIPGVTVALDHDDIFVGYKGANHWFEIKKPECRSKKTGLIKDSCKKESQKWLEQHWTGHYRIVTSLEEILEDLGVKLENQEKRKRLRSGKRARASGE